MTLATANLPPTANAGADQSVQANVPGAPLASVTLDATGSSDPDGDALTYTWTWGSGSASGPNATVTLPRGRTTLTLTVDDAQGGSGTEQNAVSNEPDDGLGDGTWDIQLRAERSARGTGRIYAITVTATDDSGNATTATGQVEVPLSQGNAPRGKR